jgi:hypothetical protein
MIQNNSFYQQIKDYVTGVILETYITGNQIQKVYNKDKEICTVVD